MKRKEKYLIGEVSEICNIPKKTLRYYDDIDVIKPETISKTNSYRYYSLDNMSDIMILKYFKQMGYSLMEVKHILGTHDLEVVSSSLTKKIDELEVERKKLDNKIQAARAWRNLIGEAKLAAEYNDTSVRIKEVPVEEYCCLRQEFQYDYKTSIVNLPWVTKLEMNREEVEGAVILHFNSFEEKRRRQAQEATILQRGQSCACHGLKKIEFGGKFLSTYHIGDLQEIESSYERMYRYMEEKGLQIRGDVFERYVVDYWTTQNKQLFVTEIMCTL
ncbi:MerR family transcriptional regulator [Lachnospiraceae bacterium oral taxon 096]|nr:MerR family transcriptional regulator [Lachnospiraceae bacterium oral taxon 096]QUI96106.1 MerR family transcriptional regulator [Lachnospiraceae bacterium oral taxon 096]